MSEFKGTRGDAKITRCQISERISVTSGLFQIAEVFSYDVLCGNNDTKEALANAKLIIDAFKVRQQINCELSELLEQRNEMFDMLERTTDLLNNINSTLFHYNHSIDGWHQNGDLEPIMNFVADMDINAIADSEQLIKKVKDNG
jgi:hypothetical protein